MSDWDDSMNDYDWYQNTGELREYFEDDSPQFRQPYQPNYNNQSNNGDSSEGCLIGCLVAFGVLCLIGIIVWLLW